MSIYRTPKSPYWQYDFQVKGRRFHGSTGCSAKRDAQRYEDEQRRKAALGDTAKPAITMNEASQIWWEQVGKGQKSHATTDYQLANLIKGLGANRLLNDIALVDWRKFAAKRRAKVSDSSVNREIQLARRVFRYVAETHDVVMPKWGKLLAPEPKERVRELTTEEEGKLFASLPADLSVVIEFALLSGQRRSSVITLLWSKIDQAGMRATVRVKGGGWHTFPLTPRMMEIILSRPKVCPQVFTYECEKTRSDGMGKLKRLKGERYPFSKQGWYRKWYKALKDAGIEDFRFHDLRHTAGTRVTRAIGNLKVTQKLLGHTNIATTARYAHAAEDDVRNAMLAAESRNSTGQANPESAESGEKLRKVK